MADREIRWPSFAAVGILSALARLFSELAGIWPWERIRPDALFCLADLAGGFARPGQAIFAYAAAGLLGDLFIGPRLGAGMAAYTATGFLLIFLRNAGAFGGRRSDLVLAGAASCLAAWLKLALEAESLAAGWSGRVAWEALGNGAATVCAYPILALILGLSPFRFWRERRPSPFNY